MVVFGSLFALVFVFLKGYSRKEKELYLALLTILLSVFFFNSVDPILGMPLYIYFCALSVVYALLTGSDNRSFLKRAAPLFLAIEFFLLIQMIALWLGNNNPASLLINKSNTDTLDLASQLFVPVLDITVWKHWAFYTVYCCFLLANISVLRDPQFYSCFKKAILFLFRLLYVFVFVEWLMLMLGVSIPKMQALIGVAFNQKVVTAIYSSGFAGFRYSVAGWLAEPSYISIVFLHLALIFSKREKTWFDFFDVSFALIACFLSGSTSAILSWLLCAAAGYIGTIFKSGKDNKDFFYLIIPVVFLLLLISLPTNRLWNVLLNYWNKLSQFLSGSVEWGSPSFRRMSILAGLASLWQSPILGVGIGTVYCHSELIQTLANIGFVGFFLSLWLHLAILPIDTKRWSIQHVALCFALLLLKIGTGMVEFFTSPILLAELIVVSPLMKKRSMTPCLLFAIYCFAKKKASEFNTVSLTVEKE